MRPYAISGSSGTLHPLGGCKFSSGVSKFTYLRDVHADVVDRDDVADSAGVGIETRRLRGVSA